jgi:uncharacterized membrane protein YjjP (DUF1212 family)
VRITSGFGGGEFKKTLRKVCTCQKLKLSFLLLNLTCIFVKNNLEMHECHNFRHVFRGTIDFARVTLHIQEYIIHVSNRDIIL